MAKTLMFIINPRAGRSRSLAPLLDAAALFSEAGYLISVRQTAARGDATRFVREEGGAFDAVVCCGGDGTLNEVVTGLMDLPHPPPHRHHRGYPQCHVDLERLPAPLPAAGLYL